MSCKTLVAAAALLLGATTFAFAQSQPNFGPNAPAQGDSFGKPPSGTHHPMSGAKAYHYRSHSRHIVRRHVRETTGQGTPSK